MLTGLREQIALEERIAKLQSEERATSTSNSNRIPRAAFGESAMNSDPEKREQDRKNFVHYMRTGEVRDLTVGTTGNPLMS
jgi:hypothetical protein